MQSKIMAVPTTIQNIEIAPTYFLLLLICISWDLINKNKQRNKTLSSKTHQRECGYLMFCSLELSANNNGLLINSSPAGGANWQHGRGDQPRNCIIHKRLPGHDRSRHNIRLRFGCQRAVFRPVQSLYIHRILIVSLFRLRNSWRVSRPGMNGLGNRFTRSTCRNAAATSASILLLKVLRQRLWLHQLVPLHAANPAAASAAAPCCCPCSCYLILYLSIFQMLLPAVICFCPTNSYTDHASAFLLPQ